MVKYMKMIGVPLNWFVNGVNYVVIEQVKHWWDKHKRSKKVSLLLKEDHNQPCELLPIKEEQINLSVDSQRFHSIDEEIQAAISPIIAAAIQDGIISPRGEQLLRCVNIPVESLSKLKNDQGVLRGFKMVNGKFAEQGKFVPVRFPAPLVAFQIASMVTGLYFQNIISEQLSIINSNLNFIIKNGFEGDKGELEAKYEWLNEIWQLDRYSENDIHQAERNLQELNALRKKYRGLFNSVNIRCTYKIGSNKDEAQKWLDAYRNSNFIEILNIAYIAEMEYLLTNSLLYKMLSTTNASPTKKELCQKRHDPNFYLNYSENYHKIRVTLDVNLNALYEEAYIYKDTIKQIRKEIFNPLNEIEEKFNNVALLNPIQSLKIQDGRCVGILL